MDVHRPQNFFPKIISKSQKGQRACSKKIFSLSPKKDKEHVPTKIFSKSPEVRRTCPSKEKRGEKCKPFTNHTKEINTHTHTHTHTYIKVINCSIAPKHARHSKGVN